MSAFKHHIECGDCLLDPRLIDPSFSAMPCAAFGVSGARTLRPPCGLIHEIKLDGFRMMVRRDPTGVRLLTRVTFTSIACKFLPLVSDT